VACRTSGFRGRTGLFEVLPMTGAVRGAIGSITSAEAIWAAAKGSGVRPLFEEGLVQVAAGVTSLEEVYRACRSSD